MVRLDKFFLVAALFVTGLTIAADQTTQVANSSLTTQVIARDIQDIKELMLIRDTSWPVSITYNPNAYYELYESPLFRDKISIRETTLGKLDYLFGLFCVEIPREWQLSIDKVVTYHLDPLDALAIGAKSATPEIIKASLNLLPYTKSALASGKTTDFMDHVFTVNGKFKVDQLIEAACDGLVCRINRSRILKFGGLFYAAAMSSPEVVCGYENPTTTLIKGCCENISSKLPLEATKKPAPATSLLIKNNYGNVAYTVQNTKETETPAKSLLTSQNLKYLTVAAAITSATLCHKLEQIYIDGYITSLELLINSEKTSCDKELTKKRLAKLKSKLTWFGLPRNATSRLQALIDKQ